MSKKRTSPIVVTGATTPFQTSGGQPIAKGLPPDSGRLSDPFAPDGEWPSDLLRPAEGSEPEAHNEEE